jgi:hypothetical protein
MVLFSSGMSLLIFCLLDLPVTSERHEVSKHKGGFIHFSHSCISFCIVYLDVLLQGPCIWRSLSSWNIDLLVNIDNVLFYVWELFLVWSLLCLILVFLLISISILITKIVYLSPFPFNLCMYIYMYSMYFVSAIPVLGLQLCTTKHNSIFKVGFSAKMPQHWRMD